MLLPFGMGEATVAKLLPEAAAFRLGKVLPLIANTKLSRLLLGYFTAKTASDQPAYYHAIHQELAQGNYTDAIRTTIEDALQIAMVGAGIAGERGGTPPETTGPYSHFEDPASVGSGKNFTRTQRQKILNANAQGNEGVVRSDKSGRILSKGQQSKKGVVPPANEAHIDHITAKSKGGSNSYKNAQVLARDENIKKSNK